MDEVNHELFNVSNLRTWKNDNKDRSLSFGCYAGKMIIGINRLPYAKGMSPSNIPVSPELRFEIEKVLKTLCEHPAPNTKFPIKLTKWNRTDDGKFTKEVHAVLSIGIDDRGIGFIAAKIHGENPIDVKISLKGPSAIENEDYADPIAATMWSLEELYTFVQKEWVMARLLTTNNMRKYTPPTNNRSQSYSKSNRDTDDQGPLFPSEVNKPARNEDFY